MDILKAVEILKNEDVVAAPTDTVYGLFGDAKSNKAIKKIYEIKGRPSNNPLIVHVSSLYMAQEIAQFSSEAVNLVNYFWIKEQLPLTVVLEAKSNNGISSYVTAGLKTIAIRCPSHFIAHNLIEKFGGPLAAPSANTSNRVSPTSALMVQNDLGSKVALILDGGICSIGIESTIIDLTQKPFIVLRPGGVPKELIENYLRSSNLQSGIESNEKQTIIAPGMMKKHYSPKLPLRINVTVPYKGEAFIGFGKCKNCDINLSQNGDLYEAARNLFYSINALDDINKFIGIAIMPIPNKGLGVGINDRLIRASAKS